jgi:hypothetical protein
VRICVAAADDDVAGELSGHRATTRKPSERIKTNPRDARKLAELLRAGLLTEVQPPTLEDEAVRDLCRARDDAREDLQRCRHRLGKLLLRKGLHYSGRNWTPGYQRWIDSLVWAQPAERVVVDDYLLAIGSTGDTPQRTRCPVGGHRGVGAVPGTRRRRETSAGRITRTGNALVRRLLVETAWHYQHRPSIGVGLTRRRKGPTRASHRDRGQGAAAIVSPVSPADGPTQTGAQGRRGDRARTGRLPLGGAPTGTAGSGTLTIEH